LKYVEIFEGSSSTMIRNEEDFYNSPQPQYTILKDMIRDKTVINIWVWNKDRLHRDNLEEEFLKIPGAILMGSIALLAWLGI
tara:strand:- start:115 stop:360 length:246 start_codon:yes stop_codon:yes gene_type:complete